MKVPNSFETEELDTSWIFINLALVSSLVTAVPPPSLSDLSCCVARALTISHEEAAAASAFTHLVPGLQLPFMCCGPWIRSRKGLAEGKYCKRYVPGCSEWPFHLCLKKISESCSSVKGSWLCSGVTDPFNIWVSVLELKLLQCCFYFRDPFSRDIPLQINLLSSSHLLLKIILFIFLQTSP